MTFTCRAVGTLVSETLVPIVKALTKEDSSVQSGPLPVVVSGRKRNRSCARIKFFLQYAYSGS